MVENVQNKPLSLREINEAVWIIIARLGKLFGSKCFVCHKKCKTGKGFTIHHIIYMRNEKMYSDFKNRLEYYRYLEPIVIANKQRFAFLCNTHHTAITHFLRFNDDKLLRLIRLVRQTMLRRKTIY